MAAMGDRQRARRIPDAEWEIWHQELVRLYVEEDVSRKDIINIMANEHNFVITDTQLKHRFQKWDVKKYINDDDMTTMLALKRKRQALGKDIRFQYKGHDVEQERLERAYRRQRRQLASPTFIQPYIKVYTSPDPSPQPASQVFVRGHSASQDLERHFNPSTSDINSQNMQASFLMNWTNDGLDPGQYGYTHNTRESGSVDVAQASQDVLMTEATLVPMNSSFGPEAGEGVFNPNGYEPLSTEATNVMDQNQASSDIEIGRPSRSGSALSAGAWNSWMNWSPSTATSVFAIDERSSDRLSLPRDTVPSPTIDIMPLLRGVESEGESVSTELRVQIANDQPIACAGFDPSSALLPLLLMKAHLEQGFCSDSYLYYNSGRSNFAKLLDTIHSEWLKLELDNVVCWTYGRVSKDIREHQVRRRIGNLDPPFEKSRELPKHQRRSSNRSETEDGFKRLKSTHTETWSQSGVLRVTLGNLLNQEASANPIDALKLSFMPRECRRTTGLHVVFFNVMSEIRGPRISPRLKTFNVIPDHSEIIRCIERNDLNGLQTLFDKREASPTDVDATGFSLLSYAMNHGNSKILRLLLEGGADTQTCNFLQHPLDMVSTIWNKFAEVYWEAPKAVFINIDQCVSMSDAALGYGCDIDNRIALNSRWPNPLFRMVDVYSRNVPPQAMMDALRYMCKIGYDIEERNLKGATLLLFAATQLRPSVISVLKFLLKKGADLCTVDQNNRGALHLALMTHYGRFTWACGSSCTGACHNFNIDHELWASRRFLTESDSYAEDYCNDGLTPAPSIIDDVQSDHLACDDDEDDERDVEDEDEEEDSGEDYSGDESDEDDEDGVEMVGFIEDDKRNTYGVSRQGNVLYWDDPDDCSDHITRKPLPILKTRLRFKLLTLLRAGCDPNVLDSKGRSPGDYARYRGLWPEWTWALLNTGYVFDEGSNRWVKRSEEDISFG